MTFDVIYDVIVAALQVAALLCALAALWSLHR